MDTIIPVILGGGSGSRLWPLSRRTRPKQFLAFDNERSLFQQTLLRCCGRGFDKTPVIVGSRAHRHLIDEDVSTVGIKAELLLEPASRNSCAAIAFACMRAQERAGDALVLILASDHVIPDGRAFRNAARSAVELARRGLLVVFGVPPRSAATSYGYVRQGPLIGKGRIVDCFVEKPDRETAERLIEEGCLWNSGNLIAEASVVLAEIRRHAPEIHLHVSAAYETRVRKHDHVMAGEQAYRNAPSVSMDNAVLEKTGRAAVLPVSYHWADVGTWESAGDLGECDEVGNRLFGNVAVFNSRGNVVHSQGRMTALLGIENMVVVNTPDAVLVARRDHADQVRQIADDLALNGRVEALEGSRCVTPWGMYEKLETAHTHQVKRITVRPGGTLSLQRHERRAEHWIVISGRGEMTIGERTSPINADEAAYIPVGEVHRLSNPGKEPLVLIEVQTGSYFGEDDIVRLEDMYGRE